MNIEILAHKAILESHNNNNIDKERDTLILLFNTVQKSSSQLLNLSNYNIVGTAYLLMSSHTCFMNDENLRRVIADNAFYCYSKAINDNPNDNAIRIKRLFVLQNFHKDFYYTIANAMDIPDNGLDDVLSITRGMPLIVKTNDFYYNMLEHDFSHVGQDIIKTIEPLNQLYYSLKDRFGTYTSEKGKDYINKIIIYLEQVYSKY